VVDSKAVDGEEDAAYATGDVNKDEFFFCLTKM
jgi:hypothetical protein